MEELSIFRISTGPWPEFRYTPETTAVMLREYAREGFLDAREGDPLAKIEADDLRGKVGEIIDSLRSTEKIVLHCIYGDYDREVYQSPYEAAASYAEISPERAKDIHRYLLRKLRRYFGADFS